MPFPQTEEEIYELNDDIRIFFELLKAEGLLPPLSKQDSRCNKHQEQPQSVRDFLKYTFKWRLLSIDDKGYAYWEEVVNTNEELDKKICLYTKKLGHILNKLAQFGNNELTKNFVERIAENLGVDAEQASKLLQEFHIFTKTPTTSRSQSSVISDIQQCVSDVLRDVSGFQYGYYSEGCVSLIDKPYISGFADGIIVITNEVSREKSLIIVEYDGIEKTQDQLSARKDRYLNVDLNKDRFVINGEIFDGIKSVDVICGNSKDQLRKELYDVVTERKAIPKTAFWISGTIMPNNVVNNGLYKGPFQ